MPPSPSAHALEEEIVLRELAEQVKKSGGQTEWARQMGVHRTSLNQVLRGKRPLTTKIIDALGLTRLISPTKQELLRRRREEVARVGSHSEYARLTGLDRTHLTHVLNGKNPGAKIIKALKITREVRYVRRAADRAELKNDRVRTQV